MRMSMRMGCAALGLACTLAYSAAVSGQEYPTRPIRIVTSGAGGGSDFVSRLIAQGISGPLGQQVIVDNKPSGVVIGETGAKATPDGYTVVIFGNGLWVAPLLQANVPY